MTMAQKFCIPPPSVGSGLYGMRRIPDKRVIDPCW